MQYFSGVRLTGTEDQILKLLFSRLGEYVSPKELDNLQPIHKHLQLWNCRVHMSAIRKKISPLGYTIKNWRGRGYKLEKDNA